MDIIVDTNIVYIAVLNSNSNITMLLINDSKRFKFYSINFLKVELYKHFDKLLRISKQSENEISQVLELVFSKINFIDEKSIPYHFILESENLTNDVDNDDLLFIALSLHFNCPVWTGDLKLINKLSNKGFRNFKTTKEMQELLINLN